MQTFNWSNLMMIAIFAGLGFTALLAIAIVAIYIYNSKGKNSN